MRKLICTAGFIAFAWSGLAQETPAEQVGCGFNRMFEKWCIQNHVSLADAAQQHLEDETDAYARAHDGKAERGMIYVVPIVFHIVHTGGPENISDEQIKDAVRILNRDYRKQNADTIFVDPVFQSIIADVEFEFRLAQKDAFGNCVSGITRTFSISTNEGGWDMADEVWLNLSGGTTSNNIYYPHDKYLNILVCKDPQGAAGYTIYPSWGASDPNHDAIWVRHDYLGSIGTSSEGRSRVLTHEVGHWMNLAHVWGSTNEPGVACGDDGVTDTPETRGWVSCNLASNDICNPGIRENVQNYMEYAYCAKMFTEGQKLRMHAAINSSVAGRNNLWQNANLLATGVEGPTELCMADFAVDKRVICAGDSVKYNDVSYHGVTTWDWSFTSGTPATANIPYPMVTYNTPGVFATSLTVSDGSTINTANKTNYITVLDPVGAAVPFSESFESISSLPTAEWFVGNPDDEQTWEVVTTAAATGNKSIRIDNYTFNGSGARDVFSSQTFDLSGKVNAQISFKYAYRQRTGIENEKLRIYISNNCGQTWGLRKTLVSSDLSGGTVQGTPFTPAADDWKKVEVEVTTGYYSQGFRFKIDFQSDGGNNIYIDDINLDINVGEEEISRENLGFDIYPNPVSSQATIEYTLAGSSSVEVNVTDITGRLIQVLEKGEKASGVHMLDFNVSHLPKGIYLVTIHAGHAIHTRKVVVE